MKVITTDEIKRIQLGILRHIDSFCKDHGIRYFLSCGSLLGAVRHHGFIPWDDDVDIVMPREDYDRFEQLYGSIDNSCFTLHTFNRDHSFPYPFIKVDDSRTVFKEEIRIKYNIGVHIDVFPADTIPDDEKERKRMFSRIRRLIKMMTVKRLPIKKRRGLKKNTTLLIGQILLLPISTKWIIKRIIENSCRYNNQQMQYIGNCVWGVGIKDTIHKECYSSAIMTEFEGERFPIPIGWEEYLTSVYGDYMQLPPEEERKVHHNYKAYYK